MVTLPVEEEAAPNYTTFAGGVAPVTQQPQPAQPAAGVNLPVTMDGMTDLVTAQRRLIDLSADKGTRREPGSSGQVYIGRNGSRQVPHSIDRGYQRGGSGSGSAER